MKLQSSIGALASLALIASVLTGPGCDDEPAAAAMTTFSLAFEATDGTTTVGCTDTITGLGPNGDHNVGISDLRFYVSNIRFLDAQGDDVALTLDDNEFQLNDAQSGSVAMVDLTGNTAGNCADNAIANSEGTARVNAAITGKTFVDQVTSVSFEIGVPQALMKQTIAANTAESAPSPLNEMYWNWASGYRHFVLNLTVDAGADGTGEGYVHIGSRDCGPKDGKALEGKESCGLLNTPKVALSGFSLTDNVVQVDIRALLKGLDFVSPIRDPDTMEVIGQGPGAGCHSTATEDDCAFIMENVGVAADGSADSTNNAAFGAR